MDAQILKDELPKRIMLYGVCGSGKTTAAKKLGELTGLPSHEVDYLTWDPGWVKVDDETQRERIAEICAGDEWILDTAYGKWIDVPLERVQLIIGLDYSRGRTFWQLLKRTVARCADKKLVCNGNVESLKSMLSTESIPLWHYRSFARKRQRMRNWQASETEFDVILFKNPSQMEFWLMGHVADAVMKREEEFLEAPRRL
jgi:adenylate kinase family enzyme